MKIIYKFSTLLAFMLYMCFSLSSCHKDTDDIDSVNPSIVKSTKLEAVDLGLNVEWASCNIGATSPEQYGGHYCWGDPTGTKKTYCVENPPLNISNTGYDIVAANFGNGWMLPTEEDCRELVQKCHFRETTYKGVKGQSVTGPNGNKLFLPYAGYQYGDSKLNFGEEYNAYFWCGNYIPQNSSAVYLYFNDKLPVILNVEYGASVRAIHKKDHNSDDEHKGGNDDGKDDNKDDNDDDEYEKPDVDYYDFTPTTKGMEVIFKIWNRKKAKVTSAKIYYGTSSPSRSINANVNGVLINGYIRGLKPGTTYYVKCVAKGKVGTTTTSTIKLGTLYE